MLLLRLRSVIKKTALICMSWLNHRVNWLMPGVHRLLALAQFHFLLDLLVKSNVAVRLARGQRWDSKFLSAGSISKVIFSAGSVQLMVKV